MWIDHLLFEDDILQALLTGYQVLTHPFVIGELAIGTYRERGATLLAIHELPRANLAQDEEVLSLIERHHLYGLGVSYIDMHLLASAMLTLDAVL